MCGQLGGCADQAVAKVFWPGREPSLMCERHKAVALRIAETMGFFLAIEMLGP